MNKEEALKATIQLWSWLAQNPDQSKGDWPGWREYGNSDCDCPLCDYAEEHMDQGGKMCYYCPLYEKWLPPGRTPWACPCTALGSPFRTWGDSEGFPKARTKAAWAIVDLCQEALDE